MGRGQLQNASVLKNCTVSAGLIAILLISAQAFAALSAYNSRFSELASKSKKAHQQCVAWAKRAKAAPAEKLAHVLKSYPGIPASTYQAWEMLQKGIPANADPKALLKELPHLSICEPDAAYAALSAAAKWIAKDGNSVRSEWVKGGIKALEKHLSQPISLLEAIRVSSLVNQAVELKLISLDAKHMTQLKDAQEELRDLHAQASQNFVNHRNQPETQSSRREEVQEFAQEIKDTQRVTRILSEILAAAQPI